MKIEQQVCSLELSKKLKELKVKQESLYYWWQIIDTKIFETVGNPFISDKRGIYSTDKKSDKYIKENYRYPAYTVAELGEMLPNGLDYMVTTTKVIDKWMCLCEHIEGALRRKTNREFSTTEANARAKMLIYLLENNLTNN